MMITEEIFLETIGMQFEQLSVEIARLQAQVEQLGSKAKASYGAELEMLLGEEARLAEALKNLSLATPDERALRETQAAQEFDRLQQALHQLRAELVNDQPELRLTDMLTQSIGWAEGMAEDNPHESIGWAEGMAEDNPHESIGWAEGIADEDVVQSVGWAEGYKHE
ncbi:MAG: hypothetical protein KDI79_16130 [Anaerolineae bacterium]|nr:hypothetical protein [Anaerolineae bacterium]